jgi:hypothetical protein
MEGSKMGDEEMIQCGWVVMLNPWMLKTSELFAALDAKHCAPPGAGARH